MGSRHSLLARLRRRFVGTTRNASNSGPQFMMGSISPFFSTVIVLMIIASVFVVIAAIVLQDVGNEGRIGGVLNGIIMGNEGVRIDEIMIDLNQRSPTPPIHR